MADTDYLVERSVVIAAPPEAIYERIADFRKWVEWSPWEGLDPRMQRSYEGPSEGLGSRYRWSGNRRAGQGRMEIVEAEPPSRLLVDLVFEKPFRSEAKTEFAIRPSESGSLVTWTMTGPVTFMTRVMGVFKSMDDMIGPDFEKGLGRMKAALEL